MSKQFKKRARKLAWFLLALSTYPLVLVLALNSFAWPFLFFYTVFLCIYFLPTSITRGNQP